MKKNMLVMMGLVVLVAGGIVIFRQMSQHAQDQHEGQHEIWYCPMHTHYISDKPGNCPICGMKLVKRETHLIDEHPQASNTVEGYAPVTIDTAHQQMMGLRTVAVVKKPLVVTIRAPGYVAHDLELYDAQLEYIDAWRKFHVKSSGWAGSEEFRKTQQRLIKAEYELLHMGLDENELAQLRAIKSKKPGVKEEVLISPQGHSVWVYAQVFESDLGFVDVGQKAVIEVPTYEEKMEGIVRAVSSVVDEATHTVRVRIQILNPLVELKANMFLNVIMPVELDDSLLVPRDAIMDTGTRQVVFVQKSAGVFEPRQIKIGFEGNGMVAVKEGLTEGEIVVAQSNFLVDSESRLQAALNGMNSPSAAKGK